VPVAVCAFHRYRQDSIARKTREKEGGGKEEEGEKLKEE